MSQQMETTKTTISDIYSWLIKYQITGKYLANLHIIVKIHINVLDAGFLNGDICRVLGETPGEKLLVKRLEDKKIGIVSKDQVSIPKWAPYDL